MPDDATDNDAGAGNQTPPFSAWIPEDGDFCRVTSGQYVGMDVMILTTDPASRTAWVALLVFGETDFTTFHIELSSLASE